MKSIFAIISQTVRSAVRSKVFVVLFVLILLAVFLLPTTVSGDGSAKSLVQVTLTYSLNVIVALISATTLWLGCSQLSMEISTYNIHMVVSKPCSRWKVWLGKWLGIFLMHAIILCISAVIVYGLIYYRVKTGKFTEKERLQLTQEILVGRREFRPVPPDINEMAEKEYNARMQAGQINKNIDQQLIKNAILDEMRQKAKANVKLKPGEEYHWTYKNVHLRNENDILFLRFRVFTGEINSTNQFKLPTLWGFKIFNIPAESGIEGNPIIPTQFPPILGGTFQEFSTVSPNATEASQTQFNISANLIIDKAHDDTVELHFRNMADELIKSGNIEITNKELGATEEETVKNYSAIFQEADGPILMLIVANFLSNYCRAILLAMFQLAFLAALGVTVGAIFSTPVAIFSAIAYIVIGMIVPMAVDAPLQNEDGSYMYKNAYERYNHYFAQGVQMLVVSVDDFDATSDLSTGRLIESRRLVNTFARVILIRSMFIALLGMYILHRRELGLVVRKY